MQYVGIEPTEALKLTHYMCVIAILRSIYKINFKIKRFLRIYKKMRPSPNMEVK